MDWDPSLLFTRFVLQSHAISSFLFFEIHTWRVASVQNPLFFLNWCSVPSRSRTYVTRTRFVLSGFSYPRSCYKVCDWSIHRTIQFIFTSFVKCFKRIRFRRFLVLSLTAETFFLSVPFLLWKFINKNETAFIPFTARWHRRSFSKFDILSWNV